MYRLTSERPSGALGRSTRGWLSIRSHLQLLLLRGEALLDLNQRQELELIVPLLVLAERVMRGRVEASILLLVEKFDCLDVVLLQLQVPEEGIGLLEERVSISMPLRRLSLHAHARAARVARRGEMGVGWSVAGVAHAFP